MTLWLIIPAVVIGVLMIALLFIWLLPRLLWWDMLRDPWEPKPRRSPKSDKG